MPDGRERPIDDRSPMAKAIDLSSRVMAAGAAVGLLAFAGYWLDRKMGWNGPGVILGSLLGAAVFGWQLYGLVRSLSPDRGGIDRGGDSNRTGPDGE